MHIQGYLSDANDTVSKSASKQRTEFHKALYDVLKIRFVDCDFRVVNFELRVATCEFERATYASRSSYIFLHKLVTNTLSVYLP